MAVIPLVETDFVLIPEGNYLWTVDAVDYKEAFNKIEVTLKNVIGSTLVQKYTLSNQGGAKAFSFMAKTALNDFDATDLDPDNLIGKKFWGDIKHSEVESNTKPGEMVKFANLRNLSPFDEQPTVKQAAETDNFNLDWLN